jgi:hypothetical protein
MVNAGVVERNSLLCLRVQGGVRILLAIVAIVAGKGEVIEAVASCRSEGLNVIYLECVQRKRLRGAAIFAPILRPLRDLSA